MNFCVLIEFHPMVGVDFHNDIVPPPALPVPVYSPHLVAAPLNWLVPAQTARTTRATWTFGRVMLRGTDIQNFIPHVPLTPACLLAPVLTAFSGSKSHFGPARISANGKPIAVAVLGLSNLNLDCGEIPTPTGIVIAPNTVLARMTFGDILGGLFAMAVDAFIQTLMNKAFGFLGPVPSGVVQTLLGCPLGFSANSGGTGVVGILGRSAGLLSDWARGAGEKLGGTATGHAPDVAQGDRDMAAADAAASKETAGWLDNPLTHTRPPDLGNGGFLDGLAGAAEAANRSAPRPPPPSPALDNALAEQF